MDLLRDRITFGLAAGRLLSRSLAAFAAAVALTLTAACGGGGGGGAAPPDPQVRASIGAAGGEVAFADQRFKLTIPAGALGNATEIVITELSQANVPASLQRLQAQKVYRLEPAGTQFAQPVTATALLPAGNAIAVMRLESNGTVGAPAKMGLTLEPGGRIVSSQIAHFSHLAVSEYLDITVTLSIPSPRIAVGATMNAMLTLTKTNREETVRLDDGSFGPFFFRDSESGAFIISRGPIAVTIDQPPQPTTLQFGETPTVTGAYAGVCLGPGGFGTVAYNADIIILNPLDVGGQLDFDLTIFAGYECVPAAVTGTAIPVGPFVIPGLTSPDGVAAIRPPFANVAPPAAANGAAALGAIGTGSAGRHQAPAALPIDARSGALAVVAGAEGTVIVDLQSRRVVLDWTTAGPDRDVLGSPTIGVLPITRPGANAPAALFGYRVNGSALRNHDPTMNAFGLIAIGLSPVFDATTVGGDTVADAFISVSPARGIEFYGFDEAAQFYRGAFAPSLSAALFPGGTLLTAYRVAAGSAVLAATRGHDGNTTSRLWAHSGSGTQAATPIATLAAEARRVRCLAPPAGSATNPYLCGVTSASGSAAFFSFDPANALAPVTPLIVPTAAGTLGIALGRRANGNPYAVVANLASDSLNLIELTPALTLVANTPLAAPAGCTRPAHPALLTDAEGDKAVVSCNGSASLWILRLFQPG